MVHAAVLDNGAMTDFTHSLTAFHLLCGKLPSAVVKADRHSAETESKSESHSHIRALAASAELR